MSSNSSSSSSDMVFTSFSKCLIMADFRRSSTAFDVTRVLLISPLVLFILYLAYQRRKQQGSLTAASHCDVFTYHLAVMELLNVFGTAFLLIGSYSEFKGMVRVGFSLMGVPLCGESLFHVLTCAERYLAVVHPHTYVGLKTARGIRIRNVIIGCVWLLCFAWMTVTAATFPFIPLSLSLGIMVVWVVVVSFCSLSVLFVLIRSRPGEKGQGKGGVDKSKQRAFLTITVILVVLSLWFVGFIVALFVHRSTSLSLHAKCAALQIALWSNIPCSLVLPLLYLQRSGKLLFCIRSDEKK